MVSVPKLVFYLSLAWIVLLIFITVLVIVTAGLAYGKMAIESYCGTWYTALAYLIVYGRLFSNYFATR
jgi:hypothetical protein